MKVDAYVVERVSKKGVPYVAVEVFLTKDYKKLCFLTQAEYQLYKLEQEKASK